MNQIVQNQNSILGSVVNFNHEKILELNNRIKKLSDICQDLNPYQIISNELQLRLAEFHILELSDPFKVTNTLLILLEDSIDELHMLCPLDEAEKSHEIL